jgi:hypothetical protein
MSFFSPVSEFAGVFGLANQYSHLFALSDQQLASRGLTREGLKQDYLAALDRAAERRQSHVAPLPSLGGFAQS